MEIIVNKFVKRQTANSRFSHFEGTWDELAKEVWGNWANQHPSYRDGVVIVNIPPNGFLSGIICLKAGDKLCGGFESRQEGEVPRKFITAKGRTKSPAKRVEVVVYSSKVLAEDGDNELPPEDNNWEIISINASPTEEEMPINPMVLMHNHFGSDGGTSTGLSDNDFVIKLRESFLFWKDKVMCGDANLGAGIPALTRIDNWCANE